MRWRISMICLLLITMVGAGTPVSGADDGFEFWNDPQDLFNESETANLARDAKLLQSTGVPVMVWVRLVEPPDGVTPETAQAYADRLRTDHQVESSDGADDGLVLLITFVKGRTKDSMATYSVGEHTLADVGITRESLQATIDGPVRAMLDDGYSYSAATYLMRETRYSGLYAPPPLPALTSTQEAIGNVVTPLGIAVVATSVALASALTVRYLRIGPPPFRERWMWVAGSLAAVAILTGLAIYGRERWGVLAALLTLLISGLVVWLWTHPPITPVPGATARKRAVPSGVRRLRRRSQARRMKLARGVTR